MAWLHGNGVRRFLGISGAALAVTLSGALLATAPVFAAGGAARTADAASGTSTVTGRIVVPGSAKPSAGVTVTLTADPATGDAITRTAVTTADGSFTFGDLAGGDWTYTVTAPYEGTTFSSDPVTVAAGQSASVKIPVFASTDVATKVTTSSWIVWLDETGDRVAVEQDLSYTNADTKAYVGKTPVSGATPGAKAAVLLPIAPGAENFQYLGRFEVCCSALQSDSWAHTRPINPGGSSGTLRYDAVRPATLTFTAQFRTDELTMLVPQGTPVSSPQLKADGTSTDKNVTYTVYKSGALKAGDVITVTLAPAAATGSTTPVWAWILLGVVGLAVVGGIVWFLLRRRSASTPEPAPAKVATAKGASAKASGTKASGTKAKPAKPVKASASAEPQAAATPVAEKPAPAKAAPVKAAPAAAATPAPRTDAEVLAEQLAQLDLKFENGELTDEAAYRRVRESLVQRLVDTVASDPKSLA